MRERLIFYRVLIFIKIEWQSLYKIYYIFILYYAVHFYIKEHSVKTLRFKSEERKTINFHKWELNPQPSRSQTKAVTVTTLPQIIQVTVKRNFDMQIQLKILTQNKVP